MNVERVDLEAQVAVVGWMLAHPDPDAWKFVTDYVAPGDFLGAGQAEYLLLRLNGPMTNGELVAQGCHASRADLGRWAMDARDFLDPRTVSRHANRIAELGVRRRLEFNLDEIKALAYSEGLAPLITRLRTVAAEVNLPDGPPMEPGETVEDLLARVGTIKPDWLIPGLLERQERVIVTAHGGVGKSFFLRQIGMCGAAGVHPFSGMPMPPFRVLNIDLENSERKVSKDLAFFEKRLPANSRYLTVVSRRAIDITSPDGRRWVMGLVRHHRPDLLCGGPVYRLYQASANSVTDVGGREKAKEVLDVLDDLRERYDCALLLEAHPPKGRDDTGSPFGSAAWEWWPDVGFGLHPKTKGDNRHVDLRRWRYDRDDREWPSTLQRGGHYGWREGVADAMP